MTHPNQKLLPLTCLAALFVCSGGSVSVAADRYIETQLAAGTAPGDLQLGVSYTLWIPDGVERLRGIIVHQHGCGTGACKGGETAAYDLHWQALARKWDCALLGPSYQQQDGQNCRLWCDPRNGSQRTFLRAIDEFAAKAGHPELKTVPWCLWGHSGGGFWASLMQTLYAERIVAIWFRSGTAFATWEKGEIPKPEIPESAYQIPMMCNPGGKENGDTRFNGAWTGTLAMFRAYRAKRAPIGFAPDPRTSHECGDSRYLAIPFFDACLAMRLPDKGAKDQKLKPVDMKQAWLATLLSDTAVPADAYTGSATEAVWLPNERVARAWMEYVKTGAVSDTSPPPAPARVRVARKDDGSREITWSAVADFESGIQGFIVRRDGSEIGRVPEKPAGRFGRPLFQPMSYHDTPERPLPEMRFVDRTAKPDATHQYDVLAVNSVALRSEPSAAARHLWSNTRLVGSPEPPPPYTVQKTFTKIAWKLPLYVAPEPGTDKLWVVQQGGGSIGPSRILRIKNEPDTDQTEPLFQLDGRLIYGLTFHPQFETTGHVFLFTNGPTEAPERMNRVSRYTVSRQPPFAWDARSEKTIIEWRSMGHDGGDLAFGRDGMLYITAGDGTSDSDTWNSGQDMDNLLATLIRIDVEHPAADRPYAVPPDNPFVNLAGARPEIWAYGFRNPWRMAVDPRNGDIWVGNNGQDLWETAYLVRRGDNFGWSVYEGNHPFYPHRKRGPTPIVPPTIEHHHSEFRSLTGGVVYYGDKLPALNGTYVYGDYSTGKIWGARHRDGRLVWNEELADTALQIAAFRVDQRGELLVVDIGGGIYRLVPRPAESPLAPFPSRLSETGLFDSVREHRVHPGLLPYTVNAPGWADGASAVRFIGLPGETKMAYRASRGWEFPDGAAIVQTLSLHTQPGSASARRIETRVLLKQDGQWAGYSYRWNDEQNDAMLVGKAGADIEVDIRDSSPAGSVRRQAWHIPSRAECLACHSRAANFVLGPSEPQMNCTTESGGRESQLAVFARLGVLDEWPPKPTKPPEKPPRHAGKLVNPYDESADLDQRARSYLHANCSVCHVEAGGGNAQIEFEFSRPRDEMNLFSARPQHDTFGIPNAMLVAPGDPDRSVLLHRVSRRGRGQMPPLVTAQVDEQAVKLFREWIRQMKPDLPFVRAWTMDDLLPDLERLGAGRSLAAGKSVFQAVGCAQCHRFAGEGGTVGPDLTGVTKRLGKRAILESLIDPSKVVADEYAAYVIESANGTLVTGRIEREDGRELLVRTGSGSDDVVRIAKSDVADRRKSPISNMPVGILHVLEKEQILDLLAYLLHNANEADR
jgi:uncharacterized repeat protein (TIGR03806 family)